MGLKLHFDNSLQYQTEAVDQVINLLKGQPQIQNTTFNLGGNWLLGDGSGNDFQLTTEAVLKNLQRVQQDFNTQRAERAGLNLETDPDLPGTIQVSKELRGMNFSIEMETGTGKTYVFLKTIYKLYEEYGFKKFIIVVPSIAIKEGTLKNLQVTYDHFAKEHDIKTMEYFVYDSKKPDRIRDFATSNDLRIMIMNIDAFNKRELNLIYQRAENGTVPIELIQGTRPILIIDEPQNMESAIAKQSIEALNYAFTLRYSATHRDLYNQIYRLTPIDAYDMGLVKKIEVNSVLTGENKNHAFVELERISVSAKTIKATLLIDMETKKGTTRKKVSVSVNDDLYVLSNYREEYKDGYYVTAIDPTEGYELVEFSNGVVVELNKSNNSMKEELVKAQIWETVREHLDKEKRLQGKGVKVLSLFFLDKVANYRVYTDTGFELGPYAKLFEEAYIELMQRPQYSELAQHSASEVHNGYFSMDRKGVIKDTGGSSAADDDTYNLIMKDKEKLLDMRTPLKFIFSHSALKEGWDNPNVFQICTINETKSQQKKRQEIGRGLRLPVNQEGQRVFDSNINRLTVIANESYDNFAQTLQKEIQDETGIDFGNRIKNARTRVPAKLKKEVMLRDENFRELWNRIKQKTKYSVKFSTEKLIRDASDRIKDLVITPPKIVTEKVGVEMSYEGISGDLLASRVYVNSTKDLPVPDVLSWLQSKTFLTKTTLLEILKRSGKLRDILINPQMFLDGALREIMAVLSDLMIDGISYEKIEGDYYEMRLFEDQDVMGYLEDNMFPVEKSIYDHVVVDSFTEQTFAKDLDSLEQVKFFLKLPSWFKIETPIGTYNPDRAIVFEDDKKLYFVAETKGQGLLNVDFLRGSELNKIKCGKKHFEAIGGVQYEVVTNLRELIQ